MGQSEITRQVVEGFLADGQGHWLAHDVMFRDRTGSSTSVGRAAAVLVLQSLLRGGAPTSVRAADTQLIVDAEQAAAQWVTELGSDEDAVHLAMAATFEVREGEIVRLDLLYDRLAAR